MFKNLYNGAINLNLNYKSNFNLNLFSFLKKSSIIKNYSNYLNYFIVFGNQLKFKTIQTSFWVFSLDNIMPIANITVIFWFFFEFVLMLHV